MVEILWHPQPKGRANRENEPRPKPARQSSTLPLLQRWGRDSSVPLRVVFPIKTTPHSPEDRALLATATLWSTNADAQAALGALGGLRIPGTYPGGGLILIALSIRALLDAGVDAGPSAG